MTQVQPLQSIVGVVRSSNRAENIGRASAQQNGERTEASTGKGRDKRRKIDPTTCERDYSPEEIEFMQAVELYKRQNRRMFPTCSELLEVVRRLGYVKLNCSSVDVRL
ncbi:MAG TPA: hypothetical protein VGE52_19645, partial [Pirellulales bacterium]